MSSSSTSPGIWVVLEDDNYPTFEQSAIDTLSGQPAGIMLTPGIRSSYQNAVSEWQTLPGVNCIAQGQSGQPNECRAALFSVDLATFIKHQQLQEEVFGASALIIKCADINEMHQVITLLKGNLTASIHGEESDLNDAKTLAVPLAHKVGRLIYNQMPTGVEVCASMNHGGPFPASTNIRSTSVGSEAIKRFARPICYQNMPNELLPTLLQD